MNKVQEVFKNKYKKALIGYLTAGYPDITTTIKAATILADNGCDIIELGIPFSDPMADGATIQRASFNALQNGITPSLCLDIAAELNKKINTPLVFMSYYNPIYNFGLQNFCKACVKNGISGIIIPDLPPEESLELQTFAEKLDLTLIYLLAPTSTAGRIKEVARKSRGFIYLVSLTGVTGSRDALSADLMEFVARVRKQTDQPLCVGFGISIPEQAKFVTTTADGVIVGSKLIQLIESDKSLVLLSNFIKELRQGIDGKS